MLSNGETFFDLICPSWINGQGQAIWQNNRKNHNKKHDYINFLSIVVPNGRTSTIETSKNIIVIFYFLFENKKTHHYVYLYKLIFLYIIVQM